MKTLITKITKGKVFVLDLIVGALIMLAAAVGLPVYIASVDPALFAEPYILGVVIGGALMFCAVGYFGFVHKFILYRHCPAVQVEADDEFLYIHGKKEAKIPLSSLENTFVHVELPFLFQKEFLHELIAHLLSEEYGTIYLEIPNYGKYKLRFVANAYQTKDEIINFINNALAANSDSNANG